MKKYILTLLAALALSGINLVAANVPQPQESWYDWSKRHARNVGHYVPSWHYAPAIAAGLVASGVGSPIIARKLFERPELGLISGYDQVHMLAAQLIPYLMALGWGAKQIEHFIRGIQSQKTDYRLYGPGLIAGLAPSAIALGFSGLHALTGVPNDDTPNFMQIVQALKMLADVGTLSAPALLGAGHLAHQYFNQPKREQLKNNIPHYMPSWHYWPAISAGALATLSGGRGGMDGMALITPYLMLGGYGLKKLENFIRGNEMRAYYNIPGAVAALAPYLQYAYEYSGGQPNETAKQLANWSLLVSPLLLGAGHLAHQYFNPPVQAPVVPVSPQQLEEQMQPKNVEQPAEIERILP